MPEGLIPLVTMKIQSTYISSRDNKTLEDVLAAVESSQAFPISYANWKEFPYTPQVSFRIAHTDKALIVLFDVTEDHVRATSLESNGPVWEDSCVEVFQNVCCCLVDWADVSFSCWLIRTCQTSMKLMGMK